MSTATFQLTLPDNTDTLFERSVLMFADTGLGSNLLGRLENHRPLGYSEVTAAAAANKFLRFFWKHLRDAVAEKMYVAAGQALCQPEINYATILAHDIMDQLILELRQQAQPYTPLSRSLPSWNPGPKRCLLCETWFIISSMYLAG